MDEKICLDTDVCISIIKGNPNAEKISDLIGNQKIFVTSITVFELYLRKENLHQINDFLDGILVLDFDRKSALNASNIQKELKIKGITLEFRDIFIASTAIENNCILATFNKKHFSGIRDLKLLNI